MTEFWESSFREKRAMWGDTPADSAVRASELFKTRGYNEILLPGIGYGRNARPFVDAGMRVTGIEISDTAIRMAKERFSDIEIFHGSVAQMPFDSRRYDAIFSYALIHLLNQQARQKFIAECYAQLLPGGSMIFTSIADTAPMFGTGKRISDRLYETMPGVTLFFYDGSSIDREFRPYDLQSFHLISEPSTHTPGSQKLDFLWIQCLKGVKGPGTAYNSMYVMRNGAPRTGCI